MGKGRKSRRVEAKETGEGVKGLVTNLQQQLQDKTGSGQRKRKSQRMNDTYAAEDSSNSEQQRLDVSIHELKQVTAEKLSALVNHLIAKNKINAKNAFEVPLIHLEETSDFTTMSGDNSWKRVSSTLQNNNKIYGYRVDATHTFTYKMLELVTRSERKESNSDEEEEEGGKSRRYDLNSLNSQFFSGCAEDIYVKNLQKNYKNINIVHLEAFFSVNPILEKTKRIFDQQGLRGLLMNNIEVGEDLALLISLQKSRKKSVSKQVNQQKLEGQGQIDPGSPLSSHSIFQKIYGICCLNDLLEQDEELVVKREESEFETLWRDFEAMMLPKEKSTKEQKGEIEIEQIIPNQMAEEQRNQEEQQNKEVLQIQKSVYELKEREGVAEVEKEEDKKQEENKEEIVDQEQEKVIQQIHQIEKQQILHIDQEEIPQQASKVQQIDQKPTAIKQIETKQNLQSDKNHQSAVNEKQVYPLGVNQNGLICDHTASQTNNQPASSNTAPKEVLISSFISFNYVKTRPTEDIILRQLEIQEDYAPDKETAVERWKNIDKKPKVPRKPRVARDPILDYVNFELPLEVSKHHHRRSSVLSVDKNKKMQVKKFLKNVEAVCNDAHSYFDMSRWKQNFQIVSFLRENWEEQRKNQGENNFIETENTGNENVIDLEQLNQTSGSIKTASIRTVKERVKSFLQQEKMNSFLKIYNRFVSTQGNISPALCFLTLLHICNELGLQLRQEDATDFEVVREV